MRILVGQQRRVGTFKIVATTLISVALLGSAGCGKDKAAGGAGTGGSAGTGAGTGAGTSGSVDAGMSAVDPTPPNPACPSDIGPATGPYAMKGDCCYRTSNKLRNAKVAEGEMQTLDYRVSYQTSNNHPKTLGIDALVMTNVSRADNEEQSLLFRFKVPRGPMGANASGMGTVEIGQGRYNCDGTYSFFGDKAAPTDRMISKDPARWQGKVTPTITDSAKMGVDQTTPVWSMKYKGESYTPFINPSTFKLEWELITRDTGVLMIPTGPEYQDCIGSRDMSAWKPAAQFDTYVDVTRNDSDKIITLQQTFCQLVLFGAGAPDDDMHSCSKTARCKPGATGCNYVELPDSLCPTTPAEEQIFGCHVGDENNVSGPGGVKYKTNCTATAPTTALDRTKDPKVSEGQCCDPMGTSTTLPKCNAVHLINDTVFTAVQITDASVNEAQQDCHAK